MNSFRIVTAFILCSIILFTGCNSKPAQPGPSTPAASETSVKPTDPSKTMDSPAASPGASAAETKKPKEKTEADKLMDKGRDALKAGKEKEAIKFFNEAIKADPKHTSAYVNKGIVLARSKKYDEAFDEFTKAAKISPRQGDIYYFRGLVRYNQKNYVQAENEFNKAAILNSQMPDLYFKKGNSNLYLKRYDKAIEDFDKSLETRSDFMTHQNRGWAYKEKGEYKKALADFTKALKLKPGDENLLKNIANVNVLLGEKNDAIKQLTLILDKNPNSIYAYANRALLYAELGRKTKALNDANMIIRIDREAVTGFGVRAMVHEIFDDYRQAAEDYEKSIRKDKNFTSTCLRVYICKKEAKEDGDKWLKEQSLAMDRDLWPYPVVKTYLGEETPDALLKRIKTASAGSVNDKKEAEKNKGKECEIYYYLGKYYQLKGDGEKAKEYYSKCLSTDMKEYVEYVLADVELQKIEGKFIVK